jgi:sensor histidine kinase YesM
MAHGAGIQNAKRRLELAYENRYDLMINEQKDYYETKLTLELD